MQYAEASRALNYQLISPRNDWTAKKEDGICISLWKQELAFRDGRPWINTKVHCQPIEIWKDKPGNKKRIRHLLKAVSDFEGVVDVIIVHGIPGEKVTSADPWQQKGRRKGYHWQVSEFEQSTGHFTANAVEKTQ